MRGRKSLPSISAKNSLPPRGGKGVLGMEGRGWIYRRSGLRMWIYHRGLGPSVDLQRGLGARVRVDYAEVVHLGSI